MLATFRSIKNGVLHCLHPIQNSSTPSVKKMKIRPCFKESAWVNTYDLSCYPDVKPSNILLDRGGCVKLCDFGISGRLVDSKAKTRSAGCAAYMAVSHFSHKCWSSNFHCRHLSCRLTSQTHVHGDCSEITYNVHGSLF